MLITTTRPLRRLNRFKLQLLLMAGDIHPNQALLLSIPVLYVLTSPVEEFATSVKHSAFSLGVLKYDVYLCKGCDRCCVFCLYCEAWSSRCSCKGSLSVSSCRCCMVVSCVHPVSVLNATFCMTCSLLMLGKDARGDHMEEVYSRAGLMAAYKVSAFVYPILLRRVLLLFVETCVRVLRCECVCSM